MPAQAVLADRLILSAIRLTRWLRAADPAPKLTGPQTSALAVIVHAGQIRMSDLARFEEVSRASITRTAGELLSMQLINRRVDDQDGRVAWLSASTVGKALLAEGQVRRGRPLANALAGLEPKDRKALEEGLDVLECLVAKAIADGQG